MGKRCPYLLLSLLGVLLIYPYLLDRPHTELLLVLLNTTVVLSAIYTVSDNRRHLVIAVVIGVPQMILSALNVVQAGEGLAIPQAVLIAGVYGYALVRVLDYVLRARRWVFRRFMRLSPFTS